MIDEFLTVEYWGIAARFFAGSADRATSSKVLSFCQHCQLSALVDDHLDGA